MSKHRHVLVKDPLRLGWRCDVSDCRFFKPAGEFDGIQILPGLEWWDEVWVGGGSHGSAPSDAPARR